MSFEKYLLNGNGTPKISNALLKSCFVLNLGIPTTFTGATAKLQIEAFLTRKNSGSPVVLSSQETNDIVNLLTWINDGPDLATKLMRKELFWALMDNVEEGTFYNDESDIRQGISDITSSAVTWSVEA